MRWKRALKRDVVDLSTAESVGRIEKLIIDPEQHCISAVVVGDRVVSWSDGGGIGPDAFTISDNDVLRSPEDDAGHTSPADAADPIGKPVITEEGEDLGELVDVDFDPHSGMIRQLILSDDEIRGSRLLGVGSYAVMVSSPGRAATSTDGLESLSKSELYDMAKERDIPGRSTMSKSELVGALS